MGKGKTTAPPEKRVKIKKGEWHIGKAHAHSLPKSWLIFAEPKVGKSSLAASLIGVPHIKRVLLIDIDGGASAIAEDYPNVDTIEFNREDIAAFEKFWKELMADPEYMGYDAVIGIVAGAIVLGAVSMIARLRKPKKAAAG